MRQNNCNDKSNYFDPEYRFEGDLYKRELTGAGALYHSTRPLVTSGICPHYEIGNTGAMNHEKEAY
jgi:hypothetical protein